MEGGGGISRQDTPEANAQGIEKQRRTLTSEEVAALVPRIGSSREAGDWGEFNKALRALAKARTPAAQKALMDLLSDLSIVFPKRVGRIFYEGLEGSSLEGIAEAARKRFEQQIASGKTSWVAADGWVDLVAYHGDDEAVAWLAARDESTQIRDSANKALAKSQNPNAVRHMLNRLREQRNRANHWREFDAFVKSHPDEGFELAAELIRLILANRLPPHMSPSSVIASSMTAVPASRLPEAKELLLELRTEADRVAAVYAVQALHNRGLDVEGLDAIVLAPQMALASMSEDDGAVLGSSLPALSDRAYLAMVAIKGNSITWSERAAQALEAAAMRLAGSSAQSHVADMKKVAAMIRAELASPWRKK